MLDRGTFFLHGDSHCSFTRVSPNRPLCAPLQKTGATALTRTQQPHQLGLAQTSLTLNVPSAPTAPRRRRSPRASATPCHAVMLSQSASCNQHRFQQDSHAQAYHRALKLGRIGAVSTPATPRALKLGRIGVVVAPFVLTWPGPSDLCRRPSDLCRRPSDLCCRQRGVWLGGSHARRRRAASDTAAITSAASPAEYNDDTCGSDP